MFHETFFFFFFFFSCKEKIKKFSEDYTHSLPTLLLAEKCTRSSWCDNREVLLWMTAEVKKTPVFLSGGLFTSCRVDIQATTCEQESYIVAVEPRRPPMTDAYVRTETAFRLDQRKHIQKSKHLLRSEVSRCDRTSPVKIFTFVYQHVDLQVRRSIYMLSVTDFDPKGTISEVRVHAGLYFGHTGCWSIAKCSQISCRNYTGGFRSWPPATCKFSTRRSFDHHGKGNGNFVQKKSFEKWKKSLLLRNI